MQQMQASYGESISIINTANTFNRASSLMLGASLLTDDDLVLFMDIDVLFDAGAIDSVRQFVVQGKQVRRWTTGLDRRRGGEGLVTGTGCMGGIAKSIFSD